MKKVLAFILTLAMVFSLVACGNKPTDDPGKEEGLGAKEIVIGFVGPLTGPSAMLGEGVLKGLQMAEEEINAAGGIKGVPVKIVYRDDESDPTKSLTYTEELIYKEGAKFLVGQCNSACAGATAEFTTSEKILVLHTVATSPTLIDEQKYPYSFRFHAPNDIQAEALVKIAKDEGYQSAIYMGDTSDLGVSGAAAVKEYAAQYGLNVVDYVEYVAGSADLTPVANQIKASGAPVILSFALGADAAKILTALDRIDYLNSVSLLGYTGTSSAEVVNLAQQLDLSKCAGVQLINGVCMPDMKMAPTAQWGYDKVNEKYGTFTVDGSGRTISHIEIIKAYEMPFMIKWMVEATGTLDSDTNKAYLEEHGTEFDSLVWETNYRTAADRHEGFNPDSLVPVKLGGEAGEEYGYHNDIVFHRDCKLG